MGLVREQLSNFTEDLETFLQQRVTGGVLCRPDSSKKVRPRKGHQVDRLTRLPTSVRILLVLPARSRRQEAPQGIVRRRRIIQERQENIAVAVGKRGHRLFD